MLVNALTMRSTNIECLGRLFILHINSHRTQDGHPHTTWFAPPTNHHSVLCATQCMIKRASKRSGSVHCYGNPPPDQLHKCPWVQLTMLLGLSIYLTSPSTSQSSRCGGVIFPIHPSIHKKSSNLYHPVQQSHPEPTPHIPIRFTPHLAHASKFPEAPLTNNPHEKPC